MNESEVSQESSPSPGPDPSAEPEAGTPGAGDAKAGEAKTGEPKSGEQGAFGAFVIIELAALAFYVSISRPMWFYLDEWDFLSNRTAFNLGDLFRPHNEHWVTLAVLAYRALWWVFGLRSYRPYQFVIIALHLATALLLRAIMRRAGVRPWTATVVASVLVFFGSGYQNIVLPFQITLVGSLVFGLVQLMLATHDGPIDRRDVVALLAGVAGLMCSGVGVSMVVAVGLAVLLRRGWRLALLHTVPLAAVYGAWYVAIGHEGYTGYRAGPGQIASFVRTFVAATFGAVGHYRGVGPALGVLLVGGLFVAWRPLGRAELRRRATLPFALLVGALVLLLITGFGRAGVGTFREKSRYLHLVLALMLPALAVAADAVMRRWRWLVAAVVPLLLVGIPGNMNKIVNYMHSNTVVTQTAYKRMMLSLPRVPIATQVPREVKPEETLAHFVTIGWLLDGVKSGRIPKPSKISSAEVTMDDLRLSFLQTNGAVGPNDVCVGVATPMVFNLEAGQRIIVRAKNNSLRIYPPTAAVFGTYPLFIVTAPPVGANFVAVRPVSFRVVNVHALAAKLCGTAPIMGAAVAAGAANP